MHIGGTLEKDKRALCCDRATWASRHDRSTACERWPACADVSSYFDPLVSVQQDHLIVGE